MDYKWLGIIAGVHWEKGGRTMTRQLRVLSSVTNLLVYRFEIHICVTVLVTEKTMVNPLDSDPLGQCRTGTASNVFLLNHVPSDWPLCQMGGALTKDLFWILCPDNGLAL